MNIETKDKFKQFFIKMHVYRPARRLYDRINPSRSEVVRENREALAKIVRPNDLCFDVGANIGRKTEAMLGLGARVVSVEPQPRCLGELNALFKGHPRWTCVPKAIGRAPGVALMHLASQSGLSSLRADWLPEWESEVEVEMTTLDALIAEHGVPRYIKLDIEGFELEALNGLSRAVEYVSFEFSNRFVEQSLACVDYLARFGDLRLNLSLMEDSRMLAEDGRWWDHAAFLDRFHAELARNPENWGGDIFVHVVPALA